MGVGLKRRLSRIFRKDGKALIVAIDHGIPMGAVKGIENPRELIEMLIDTGVDGIIINPGLVKALEDVFAHSHPAIILKMNGITSNAADPLELVPISSVEDAIRLGADAVSYEFYFGGEREHRMMVDVSVIAQEARVWEMPLIIHAYPSGEKYDTTTIMNLSRAAVELGADVVKTFYTNNFEKVVNAVPVPVIIAGGERGDPQKVLATVKNAIKAGAAGIAFGRNIWGQKNPRKMIEDLISIIHG